MPGKPNCEFLFCQRCRRYAWFRPEGKVMTCCECGRENKGRYCELCGEKLESNERSGLCSLCVSAEEHIGDLGWEV